MSRIGWTLPLSLACACGPATRPTGAPLPTSAPAEARSAPVTSPGPPPPAPGPDLTPLSPTPAEVIAPVIRIPANGSQLSRDAAAGTRVDLDGTKVLPEGAAIGFVLDDFRIRYVEPSGTLALGDLVSADRALEPGPHRLAVVVRLPDGALARGAGGQVLGATSRFSVGPARAADPDPLVYLEPQGTYNGPAAANGARLEFALSAEFDEGRVVARIIGGGGRTVTDVVAEHAYGIGGLKSGDYEVTLTALDRNGTERQAVTRAITVNLDAPLSE